jgi:alanine dehydrogenase
VPRTSTFALNNATLPFVMALANKGAKAAMAENAHLLKGLNVHAGKVTYEAVAREFGHGFTAPQTALAA